MASAPLVEPAAPELRAHLWCVRTQLAKTTELIVDVGTRAEVHRPGKVVQSVLLEVARPVALEQCQFLAIDTTQTVANLADVRLILAIRAILVLYLHHNDRTTILDSQRLQLLTHLLLEDLYALHEVWVALTQFNILLLQQPPRQTTHLPFRTHIGTRTHDDIHAVLLCDTAKLSHIVITSEVKLTLFLLMDIPEHIDTHRVHAQSLTHLNAMIPVSTGNTGIVNLGCLHHERFAVEKERLVTRGKRTRLAGCLHRSRCCQQQCREGKMLENVHSSSVCLLLNDIYSFLMLPSILLKTGLPS